MSPQIYLIGDLARTTEFSIDTINYYIRVGLLDEVGRSPRNNYRYFDEGSVELLEKIKSLRLKRVSIKEILRRKKSGIL